MRILLLTTAYLSRRAFRVAAQKLSVEVVTAIDLPDELGKPREVALTLDFRDPDRAAQDIVAYAHDHSLDAILSVDDSASLLAAQASAALGLPHNSPRAAEAARNKFVMRTLLKQGGVRVPNFQLFSTATIRRRSRNKSITLPLSAAGAQRQSGRDPG
jgi:biotin carboxylase